MSQFEQTNKPRVLNLDKSRKDLTEREAWFLLNHESFLNIHDPKRKGNLDKSTGVPANYPACHIDQPSGEVYSIGTYRSPITNELYSFHLNTNGVDYILRIDEKGCQVVYVGCLNLSPDPKRAITQFRAYLDVEHTCKNRHGKQLIWVTGEGNIYQLDVEASIATNYFTTPFFETPCTEECDMALMCVPMPCECIHVEYVPLVDAEKNLSNFIMDMPLQFIVRHIYYDNRMSEWSDPSQTIFQDSKGCFDTSKGFPRCVKLRIPVGNALVDRIEVAFSKNGVDWSSVEIIEKYRPYNDTQQFWYERTLSEQITGNNYSDGDCSFDYTFCNDKQCDAIDPASISRVHNPMPRDVQCLIPIKDALGFINYREGTCQFSPNEAKKFDILPDCQGEDVCTPEYATITVRLLIHNFALDKNQFVYRMGGGGQDDPADMAFFGGLNDIGFIGSTGGGFENGYDQNFDDKTRNFNVYIEGTDIWAEMKQYHSDKNFTKPSRYEIGVVADMNERKTQKKWDRDTDNGNFFYSEAKLKVKKGTKGFLRLTNHHELSGVGSSQDTSTFVLGTYNINNYHGDKDITNAVDESKHEIYFNTCNGDQELFEAFVIMDNAVDSGLIRKASAYHGYITDKSGNPVANALIYRGGLPVSITDYNGFYHFYILPGENGPINLEVRVENDGGFTFNNIHTFTIDGEAGENAESNQVISDDAYDTNFYANVSQKVVDCNGVGISGVRVALSGNKYAVTGIDGIALFKVRNNATHNLSVRSVLMDHAGCFTLDCNNFCNPCIPESSASIQSHFINRPSSSLQTMVVSKESTLVDRMGLKNGGSYQFGFVLQGRCGYLTDVNEVRTVNMPRAQDTGDIHYCSFKYDGISKGKIKFPPEATCLKIVRTKNLNPFVLQWSVDKIERISGGRIRLTIQSLNDYNSQYNFKTNTVYGYLKGDRVEFIRNGDGKIFKTSEVGLLNYQTLSPFHDKNISKLDNADADYFNQLLIEDDGRLSNLKEGAVIEITHERDCAVKPTYYTMCATIPIVDGELIAEQGKFTTFDTHLVNRQIGKLPPQPFEHHSPSDFWGSGVDANGNMNIVDDAGRAYIVNKFANERRYGRNISINAANQKNYFGDLIRTFDAPEQGDIIAAWINDGKTIIAIGENDNFLAQASDDLIRIDSDGIVRAKPADAIVSNIEPKIRGRYGCQYPHIGSVYFGDGYATWWDVNSHKYIKHDYSSAKPVSDQGTDTFFRIRSQQVEEYNSRQTDYYNHLRFTVGRNSITGSLYITTKSLRDGGIYNEAGLFLKNNDTIVYNPDTDEWLGLISFTPEAYGTLSLKDKNGCNFISFLHGQPYIHPIVPEKFNEFYGIAVDRYIGISINKFPEKRKGAVSYELQDQQMWFLKEVTTDTSGFVSEVPPIRVKGKKGRWNASFLHNKNSREGLYGNGGVGVGTKGYHIDCLFVKDNTDELKYGSLNNDKRLEYDELDLILFKFIVVEQVGFSDNL